MFYVHETNNDVELGHLTRMTQAARRHCESPQLIWKELRGPPPMAMMKVWEILALMRHLYRPLGSDTLCRSHGPDGWMP